MITQQHGHALGSDIVLTLRTPQQNLAEPILKACRVYLAEFEARFSRFLPTSELSYVNQKAGTETEISPEMYALASCSFDMQTYSGGLYNPLILPDLQRAGYVGSWPSPETIGKTLDFRSRHAESNQVSLTSHTITLPPEAALDFGGIGKGYALDALADIAERAGCTDFWFSLGGDVILRGTEDAGMPWRVLLDAIQAEEIQDVIATVSQKGRTAIATSSRMKRRGTNWHHIIDPRSGQPAVSSIESVTVASGQGVYADVLAKCMLIAADDVKPYWKSHRQRAAYVQYNTHWELLR